MGAFARAPLCAALAFLVASPALADDGVVGIWSATARSSGGLGEQWTFREGGTVTITFGALVDFKYEINGSRITMTLLAADRSLTREVLVQEFLLSGDMLTTKSVNPKERVPKQVMTRAGSLYADQNPIVGEWTFKHYTGVPAFMRYTSSGIAQLSVPSKSVTGTYMTSGDALTISMPGQNPVALKFTRENDLMGLSGTGSGTEGRYLKFVY